MDKHEEIRERAAQLRSRAYLAGPLHAAWDLVFDAEAFLKDRQTLRDWDEDTLLRALREAML